MENCDSIKLDFKNYEEPIVEEEWKENVIKIKKYISESDQVFLYKTFIDIYFEGTEYTSRYLSANYSMVLAIVNLCTNIDTENIDMDKLISSGLWALIRKNIVNYNYVMKEIDKLVDMVTKEKMIEAGLGYALTRVVQKLLETIEKVDLTDGNIAESIQKLLEGMESLKETGVVFPKEIIS